MSDTRTVHVVVSGRVQGVYYRSWLVEAAKQTQVNGWCRNRLDGTVEAIFSGSKVNIEKMISACWQGSPASDVMGVEVVEGYEVIPQGFVQKPTG